VGGGVELLCKVSERGGRGRELKRELVGRKRELTGGVERKLREKAKLIRKGGKERSARKD